MRAPMTVSLGSKYNFAGFTKIKTDFAAIPEH